MLYTNPIYGFIRNLLLFITGRVNYSKEDIGKNITMEDGKVYTVFRRVIIKHFFNKNRKPEGLFIIRFKPDGVTIEENIRFSRKAMMVFQGFKGFRTKYWTVDYNTGECQGIYEWDSYKDAVRYSKSIAVKVMTNRSENGSVSFKVLENTEANRNFKIRDKNSF
ncbi:hypothetical protein CTM_19339 [Clostridium tetanomorphum DSM 665]|uniref:YdhR family protein n=1 Tax=Clostridium tetanomorphum TaxID=1553 RepID=A0A923E6V1_CLOTT|nr:hypothetical protein [Clostridium tetanomorphum]KAJ49112.1 hypothetical protein CTM_24835 [Clostridium tetanomorphum DSM 665]KAJ50240.1 hypothetical protein CTM_19339 [Clostridium tetanomorphum DSM 665]MBC2396201.1 YdhR family protein [Clostridium tetanomorphum]MBP1864380.1 hypothetical protein [Clostridium tetanomorphum]NRZ97015.1 hypothetical protein [Clostridium tetanomorphum]